METSPIDITKLLRAWAAGDQQALDRLIPIVYGELRRIAARYMAREKTGHELQTTALVHEVYVRLVGVNRISWQNRAHFLGVCAQLMRQVLTDMARARLYRKRGGDATHVTLDERTVFRSCYPDHNLIALDDALKELARLDERKSRVVELRFFGGLDVDETAEVLGISPPTVHRDWKFAKSWLFLELSKGKQHGL